ncbi:hypothetical protein niasHT_004814 [Heterodera trifolii]|uniref:RING-type domain-containing protein n=1 Tax=Heterodera trifolii TaxID=157864 RepID=A0ABD2MC20_9BILA
MRKVNIKLNAIFNDGNEIVQKYLNGKDIEIEVPSQGEKKEKIVLRFSIVIMANEDEIRQNEGEENDGTATNMAQNQSQNAIPSPRKKAMAQRRSVEVALYKPNFSKRYIVNLGSMEPTDIFWHRKIFVEAKNGEENAPENFHAFLYVCVGKKLRWGNIYEQIEYDQLLGYAPVVFKSAVDEIPTNANNDGTNEQQRKLLEYNVKIPIDLMSLFKHEILNLGMYLYRFNEKELTNPKKLTDEKDKKDNNKNENDLSDEICAICLDPLTSKGKEKQKFHSTKGKNHEFHRMCIKKWIEFREKIHCPLCNKEAELSNFGQLLPIFSAPSDAPLAMYKNPLAELYRRAQSADNAFVKAQSQFVLASIVRQIGQVERRVRNSLANLHILVAQFRHDESLFGIDRGTFSVNAKLMSFIQTVYKHPHIITNHRDREQFFNAFDLIKWAEVFQSSEANDALESMQLISEEMEEEGTDK